MLMFRGDAPRAEMAAVLPPLPRLGFKLLGRALFRDYPFKEAYFLPMARRFREALSLPLILLGGINTVETIRQAMAEGFEFVAMGRALLRDPDLVDVVVITSYSIHYTKLYENHARVTPGMASSRRTVSGQRAQLRSERAP